MRDRKFLLGMFTGFFLLGVVVMGFYGCGIAADKSDKKDAVKEEAVQPVEQMQNTAGAVVYTFSDATEMQEFERIYAAKMNINARIGVLANYIAMERNNLEQIDAQIYLKYKFTLDPNKMYNLDRENMTITELKAAPASAQPAEPKE